MYMNGGKGIAKFDRSGFPARDGGEEELLAGIFEEALFPVSHAGPGADPDPDF
jgi:hypothetical protein